MKCHLILYDRMRAKPPSHIWLANGDKAVFLTGHERDEYAIHGMEIASVVPALDEWPPRLAAVIRARMAGLSAIHFISSPGIDRIQ